MKKWLESNKIFFEIFSLSLLGIASVFVSVMSWRVADAQLEMSVIKADITFTKFYSIKKDLH